MSWDAGAIEFALEALRYLSAEDPMARRLAAMVLAIGYLGQGDLEAVVETFAEAIAASQAANDPFVAINALCELADLNMTQGKLHQVAAACQDALQIIDESKRQSKKQLPIAGYAYGRMSVVLRGWNDLAGALNNAQKSVELCSYWGKLSPIFLANGCSC